MLLSPTPAVASTTPRNHARDEAEEEEENSRKYKPDADTWEWEVEVVPYEVQSALAKMYETGGHSLEVNYHLFHTGVHILT